MKTTRNPKQTLAKATAALFTLTTTLVLMTGTASAQVDVTPDGDGIPGAGILTRLLNGFAQIGLIASAGAVVFGAGLWGWSNYSDRAAGVNRGQKMALGGVLGAVVIGAVNVIINTAFTAGVAG